MAGYSLENVRESFVQDMTFFLDRIDATTLQLDREGAIQAIAADYRSIRGITAMVGADTLARCARVCEYVMGTLSDPELTLGTDRNAAAVAKMLPQATELMRNATRQEYEKQGTHADAVLENEWRSIMRPWSELLHTLDFSHEIPAEPVNPALSTAWKDLFADSGTTSAVANAAKDTAAVQAAPSADANQPSRVFDFSGIAAATPAQERQTEPAVEVNQPVQTPGVVDEEMQAIFGHEVREIVVSLQGFLRTLATAPDDASSIKNLERLYHTLRGSAATVGLLSAGEIAQELSQALTEHIDAHTSLPVELLPHLIRRTNDLLELAGLPRSIQAESAALKPNPEAQALSFSVELREIYYEDARSILAAAAVQLAVLAKASNEVPLSVEVQTSRQELDALFHRLKGTALVYNDIEVSVDAERMQAVVQSDAPVADAHSALEAGLRRIAGLLDLGRLAVPPSVSSAPKSEANATLAETQPPAAPAPPRTPQKKPVQLEADRDVLQAFEFEFKELTRDIEQTVLELEETAQPKVALSNLMRFFHTLKGAANSIGLAPMGQYVHHVEDFLENLLSAPILPPLRSVAKLLLLVEDRLRQSWREAQSGFVTLDVDELLRALGRISASETEAAPGEARTGSGLANSVRNFDSSVRLVPREPGSVPRRPGDSGSKAAGSAKDSKRKSKRAVDFEDSEAAEHQWIRVPTQRLDSLMNLTGELVVARSRMQRRVAVLRALQRELTSRRKRLLGTIENFKERHEFNSTASLRFNGEKTAAVMRPAWGIEGSAHVSSASLNSVATFTELELDHYDEINILARSLNEFGHAISDIQRQIHDTLDHFSEDSEAFSRVISELQGELTSARMVSVNELFARLRRPIWDACDSERKAVRVVTQGEMVDLDKTIMDALYLPMLHLVRNAVAHGIEAPAVRTRAGKDATGTITLSAQQDSGRILLDISDDGAGIDLTALRNRGVSKGLLPAGTPVDSSLVLNLVFSPGISTRYAAGNVSGRGMGCDIVRREIERMNGQIEVLTTPGKGARFRIALPYTLAISKALLIRCAGKRFAIPLHFAERMLDLSSAEIVHSTSVPHVRVDDAYLQVRDLAVMLGIDSKQDTKHAYDSARSNALVLRFGERRELIRVEEVLGQQEIVVKSLGDIVSGHPFFSGVTIGGEGELILILDIARMIEQLGDEVRDDAETDNGGEQIDATNKPAQLRVLFVDDSLSVRKVSERTLVGMGINVTLAVDGIDALEKLRDGSFDVVFTDLEMPRMNGFDLISEMRSRQAFKSIPIIVVTSRTSYKHRAEAMSAGASDYVTKPFTKDILEQKLKQWNPHTS